MTLSLLAGAFLAGCATEPAPSQARTPVPALAQDRGRIYFYRSSRTGTQDHPFVKLNGLVVGAAKPRSFFFVDRPPGRYIVEVAGAASKCALTLDKGQKCYVRVDYPSKGTGKILGEVALTPIVLSLVIGVFHTFPPLPGGPDGPIAPAPVASATGEREILKCHGAGSYWSSLGYGGEIQEAAASGDLPRVEALLKADPALISLQDASGWTPLFFAVASGYTNVPGWLLEHGADVNAATHGGSTALHWAAVYDQKVMAELLLANKAQVDARDSNGETPLHKTAANGSRDIAELLVAWRADVEAKAFAFPRAGTPLHFAARSGQKEVAEFLLAHGATVDSRDRYGQTPLDEAARQGDEVISALLLSNKADVNTRNNFGVTPLHWAALYDHKEEAELLLAHGAEVNTRNNRGKTPLGLAPRHKAVAELLRQHGGHE